MLHIVTTPQQLFELKNKQEKTSHIYLNVFFDALYIHKTGHTYTRLTFVISVVDNEFSSKYRCIYRAYDYDK